MQERYRFPIHVYINIIGSLYTCAEILSIPYSYVQKHYRFPIQNICINIINSLHTIYAWNKHYRFPIYNIWINIIDFQHTYAGILSIPYKHVRKHYRFPICVCRNIIDSLHTYAETLAIPYIQYMHKDCRFPIHNTCVNIIDFLNKIGLYAFDSLYTYAETLSIRYTHMYRKINYTLGRIYITKEFS